MLDKQAYKLLRKISKSHELTLRELNSLIIKKYGDHRDYYLLANLIKSGFIDAHIEDSETGKGLQDEREKMLAIRLYAMCQNQKEVKYDGMSFVYSGKGNMIDEKFYCTAKSYLYIQDKFEKRKDRIITISIGILIGIITALAGAYFNARFNP